MNTAEDLIGQLAARLDPVRPISPWRRGAALVLGSVAIVAAATLVVALGGDRHHRLLMPDEVVQWAGSVATGVLSLLAAAMLAQPDRSRGWVLMPLPAVAVWLAALGFGWVGDILRLGPPAMTIETSWGCVKFIVLLGLPLTMLSLFALRHAWPVRAVPVAVMVGLGAAGLCSAGLSLFHHLDAALMVLVWHGLATLLLVVLSVAVGQHLSARLRIVRGGRRAAEGARPC
jgi:hypothetical protein